MRVSSLIFSTARWLLLFFPFLLMACVASAQQPQVSAELAPNPIAPNQLATYTITIDNGNPSGVPELRLPPGWSTGGAVSTQNEVSFINGQQTLTVRFSWSVTCTQEGLYTFPAQDVPVGRQILKTNELPVEVKVGAQPPQPNGPGQGQNNGLGRLEPILQLHMEKTEFYQGEIVPVSATLYLPRSLQFRRMGLIEVEKSDLAIQRFPQQAEQSLQSLGGQQYLALHFRSSLSALKTGKMKVGPAKTEINVNVPLRNSGFPFGLAPMDERKLTVTAIGIPITVLPLPTEGRPAGFSGAVGDFTMTATASATEVTVGEPVAVDVLIEGQGNFDAIEAPVLSVPDGWKTYPPKRYNVDSGDPNTADLINRKVGFNGIFVPEKVMTEIPSFEFAFFSPRTKRYEHLRSQPIPISIKPGADEPATTAASKSAPVPPPTEPPTLAPEADITDILMPIPPQARFALATTPLLSDPRFTVANGALLAAFLALIGWTLWQRSSQRHRQSPEYALSQRWQEVVAPNLSEAEFYRRAVHYVMQASPGALPESTHSIFAAYEALNFAGPSAGSQPVDGARRAEALAILKKLPKLSAPARLPAGAVVMLLVLGFASVVQASPQDQYQAAAQALEKGDYKAAQKIGQDLVRDGHIGPELFALLGHASYKQGQPGLAAVWYQRAQMFPASAPELRQNLKHIEEKIHFFTFERNLSLERYGHLLSRNAWLLVTALGGWLIVFCITFLALGARPPLRGLCVGVLILGAGLATAGMVGYKARPDADFLKSLAFVTAPKAIAHTAASQVSGTVINVPPGSVVRVLNTRGSWTYIEIPSTNEILRGWLPTGQIESWWPFDPAQLP